MVKDAVFNFAFINHMLRRFPPLLAAGTDHVASTKGFETLLVAIAQSPLASRHIHLAFAAALDEINQHPQELVATRESILSEVKVGARILKQ